MPAALAMPLRRRRATSNRRRMLARLSRVHRHLKFSKRRQPHRRLCISLWMPATLATPLRRRRAASKRRKVRARLSPLPWYLRVSKRRPAHKRLWISLRRRRAASKRRRVRARLAQMHWCPRFPKRRQAQLSSREVSLRLPQTAMPRRALQRKLLLVKLVKLPQGRCLRTCNAVSKRTVQRLWRAVRPKKQPRAEQERRAIGRHCRRTSLSITFFLLAGKRIRLKTSRQLSQLVSQLLIHLGQGRSVRYAAQTY